MDIRKSDGEAHQVNCPYCGDSDWSDIEEVNDTRGASIRVGTVFLGFGGTQLFARVCLTCGNVQHVVSEYDRVRLRQVKHGK